MAISIIDGRRTGLRDGYTNSPERAAWLATLGTKGGIGANQAPSQPAGQAAPQPVVQAPTQQAAQAAPVSLRNFSKPQVEQPQTGTIDRLRDVGLGVGGVESSSRGNPFKHSTDTFFDNSKKIVDGYNEHGIPEAMAHTVRGVGRQGLALGNDLIDSAKATGNVIASAAEPIVRFGKTVFTGETTPKGGAAGADSGVYGRDLSSTSAVQGENLQTQQGAQQSRSVGAQQGATTVEPQTPEQEMRARNDAADVYRKAWQANPSAANGLRGANSDALTLYNAEQSTRGTAISAKRGENGVMEFSGDGANALPQSYTHLGSLSADQLKAQSDRARAAREEMIALRDEQDFNSGRVAMRGLSQDEIATNMLTSNSRTDRTNAMRLIGEREATRASAATDAEKNRLEGQKLQQLDAMGLRRDAIDRDRLALDREQGAGTVELRTAQARKANAEASAAAKKGLPTAGAIADEMSEAYSTTADGKADKAAAFELRGKIAQMQVPVTENGKTTKVNFAEFEQYDPEGARAYAEKEIKPLLLINKALEAAGGKRLQLTSVSSKDGGLRGASMYDQGAGVLDGLFGRDGVMTENGFALMKNIPESEHEIVKSYLDRLAKQRAATGK